MFATRSFLTGPQHFAKCSTKRTPTVPDRFPPRFHDGLPQRLMAQGKSPEAVDALLRLDSAMFLWHRMAMKGEVPGRLIAELGLDLDLTQFYCLTAINRIRAGIGRPEPQPATIGLLAEEMNIDPSRASRLAADLIAQGYLRREAVQEDGRKSVLVLTDKAVTAFTAFRDRKWEKLVQVYAGWTDAELDLFSSLFTRYCAALRRVYHDEGGIDESL